MSSSDNRLFVYSGFLVESVSQNATPDEDDVVLDPFFERTGWCPYCREQTSIVYSDAGRRDHNDWITPTSEFRTVTAFSCHRCNWWDVEYAVQFDVGMARIEHLTLTHGILKSYDVKDLGVPVATLREVVESRMDLLNQIHPKKMEELVGSVFGDFYDIDEVRLCGKSHDGGIDLVLVQSETPIAVQVKTRRTPNKGESVAAVRDFLGAMTLRDFTSGIFVTTADRFSLSSQNAARSILSKGRVSMFELVDRNRFLDMVRETSTEKVEPWREHLGEIPKEDDELS